MNACEYSSIHSVLMQTRQRAFTRRSRSGCQTCRIRRVKCDETKPACEKCTSTGRTCEWIDTRTTRQGTSSRSISPSTSSQLSQFPEMKALELRSFEFFCNRTAHDLPGFFGSDFWETMVKQLSRSTSPVLHAAIALGALHEREEKNGMLIAKERLDDPCHQLAVRHYNIAIGHLRKDLEKQGPEQRQIILVTCLVFIHVELLRGRYEPAKAHLRSGLGLLRSQAAGAGGGTEKPRQEDQSTDEALEIAFTKLDLQCAHFDPIGPFRDYPILVAQKEQPTAAGPFESLTEAKTRCDHLLGSSFKFLSRCTKLRLQPSEDVLLQLSWEQNQLNLLYEDYMKGLDVFAQRSRDAENKMDSRGTILIRLVLLAVRIMVSTSLVDDEEIASDDFLADFKTIVSLASLFILDYRSSGSDNRLPTFSTDWGIIPALYLTTTRCRHSQTRREAHSLLIAWRHREGFWDASLVGKVAGEVIRLEETFHQQEKSSDTECPGFRSRLGELVVDLEDDQSQGILLWKRRGPGPERINESYRFPL